MHRQLLPFVIVLSAISSTHAAEPVMSWLKVERTRGDRSQILGYVATEMVEADGTLRITHKIKMGNESQQVIASTFIEYAVMEDRVTPKAGEMRTDISGSAKVKSLVTFADQQFTEQFTMTRDREGNPVDAEAHESTRDLKHPSFLHLWALPNLAARILPASGETVVAFPKFPDASSIPHNSSITEDKYLYYYLKRSDGDGDAETQFRAGPAGTERIDWILLLSKEGKFQSLEMPRRMLIRPATESDFESFLAKD